MKKQLLFAVLLAAASYATACTNFIVGKKASADGSVFCTYNADSYGAFMPLYHFPAGKHAPGELRQIHYWDDYLYIEIIDPHTLKPVPDGEMGEIVITTLVKEGAPLIRYRTHDLSRIIPGECPCGSKHPRLDTIMGRTDDMMKIKGVNVFPSQIEEILQSFPEASSEYQIRISHLDGKDTMRIYVETNGSVDFQDLANRIAAKVKSVIGFTPIVTQKEQLSEVMCKHAEKENGLHDLLCSLP